MGGSVPRCMKCGYDACVHALQLVDARTYLSEAKTTEEKLRRAKEQLLLCSNCYIELKSREVEMKVVDINRTPILVEFYQTRVTITKQKVPTFTERTTDALEAEIVRDAPNGIESAKKDPRRIEAGQVLDV